MTDSTSHKIGTKGINGHHGINCFLLSHGRITVHKLTARNGNILRGGCWKMAVQTSQT